MPAATAASLQVSPVTLYLQANQAGGALWLSNDGDQPLQAQVRVFAWSQENGEDVYLPTNELVASPPMVVIQPKLRQLIRIARVNAGVNPPAAQQTYRVVLDELPLAVANKGVQFALRYSIPVFVLTSDQSSKQDQPPKQSALPPIAWSVQRSGKKVFLVATNNGTEYAKVVETSFTSKNGKKTVLSEGLFGYVLANKTRRWDLTEGHNARVFADGGMFNALVNEQPIAIPITAAP